MTSVTCLLDSMQADEQATPQANHPWLSGPDIYHHARPHLVLYSHLVGLCTAMNTTWHCMPNYSLIL